MHFNKSKLKTDWFIGLLIMLSFWVISEFGLLNAFDHHAYNLGVQFSSEKDPHEDIVVIAIDDKSLRALRAGLSAILRVNDGDT
jgi:CHASE2 domain-containing sensor protein